jgi:hypothetical protein
MAPVRRPVIVLPCCERDLQMLLKNLQWMTELDGQQSADALVAQDPDTNRILARQVIDAARAAFQQVDLLVYDRVPSPMWPFAPNWAFQSTAWHMYQRVGRPWFWCEADCVPLSAGWLNRWFDEYEQAGRPLMGAVVEGRGHCNGTAIYPANFPELSPNAMRATDVAWDWVMRAETIAHTHPSRLLAHCWGIVRDQPHPYEGPPASFRIQAQVDKWVRAGAVLFHRSKDGTLIDRLRERLHKAPAPILQTAGGGGLLV